MLRIALSLLLFCLASITYAQTYVYSNADDGFVNIRQEASAQSSVIDVLYNGKQGAILLDSSNKYWYKVNKDGKIGYVNKRYSKLVKSKETTERKRVPSPNNYGELIFYMTKDECLNSAAL